MRELEMGQGMGRKLFFDYGIAIRDHLDEFAERVSHRVTVQVFADAAIATITILPTRSPEPIPVEWLEAVNDDCPHIFGIKIVGASSIQIVKPNLIERWTNLNAWRDSTEVICLVLNSKTEIQTRAQYATQKNDQHLKGTRG